MAPTTPADTKSSAAEISSNRPFSFLYFSDILGRPVEEISGARIGYLDDLTIDISEQFPKVRQVVIRQAWPNRLRLVCRWSDIADFRAANIRLRVSPDQLIPAPADGINEVRLRRHVLDKQVVDTSGLKLVRVNDIQFIVTASEMRLVHADVGIHGLVRRLGIGPFIDRLTRRLSPDAGYLHAENLISWRFIETLSPGTSHQSLHLSLSRAELKQVHPTDIAELLNDLDPPRRLRLFRALDSETRAKALASLPDELQMRLLESMPRREMAELLGIMPPDEAADLLGHLREDLREDLLARMAGQDAREVQELLAYPAGTAGSLMTTEFITLRENLTVGEALDQLRGLAPSAETVYYAYVLNDGGALVGVLSLRTLITEAAATPLKQVMLKRPVSVQAEDSLADCAALVAKYKLLALPVARRDKTMVGVITVDDVFGEVLSSAWTRKFSRRATQQ